MATYKKIKILYTSAYTKELSGLCDMGRHYKVINGDCAYLAAGIGPVAAAFGLTHFLEDYRPERIICIGTAGSFVDVVNVGDVVQVRAASYKGNLDGAKVASYATKSARVPFNTFDEAGFIQKDQRLMEVFCPQEVTLSSEKAAKLKSAGFYVENLEMYALGFVAHKFKIPIVGLLGVTNKVGPEGSDQWRENEAEVLSKLTKFVNRLE